MDKIKISKGEVRSIYFAIVSAIKGGVKHSGLKYAISRTRRSLLQDVETIEEIEADDADLAAFRKALKDEKAVTEKGEIVDEAKFAEISKRAEYKEALDQNKKMLKEVIEVEVYKIEYEYAEELHSSYYDILFPLILEKTEQPEGDE